LVRDREIYESHTATANALIQESLDEAKRKEIETFEAGITKFGVSVRKVESETSRVIDGVVYRIKNTKGGQVLIPDEAKTEANGKKKDGPIVPQLQQSFWLAEETPDAKPVVLKEPSKHTMCSATSELHVVSIRKIFPVVFSGASDDKMCPLVLDRSMSNTLVYEVST
jgi:hypothetical protein